jgi:hypothetical protein
VGGGVNERPSVLHYLLLALAVLFWIEAAIFFTSALRTAGHDTLATVRCGLLTIGVFVTAATALFCFIRRIEWAGAALAGLLLAQPAISGLLPPWRVESLPLRIPGLFFGAVAALLLVATFRHNR